jgi:hypothetical protein
MKRRSSSELLRLGLRVTVQLWPLWVFWWTWHFAHNEWRITCSPSRQTTEAIRRQAMAGLSTLGPPWPCWVPPR